MKNILKRGLSLFILVSGVLFSINAVAETTNNAIVCPATVTCTQDESGKTNCTYEGSDSKYWEEMPTYSMYYGSSSEAEIPAGLYTFSDVVAPFHAESANNTVSCGYCGISSQWGLSCGAFRIDSKKIANLEALADQDSKWVPHQFGFNNEYISCNIAYIDGSPFPPQPHLPESCPLKVQSALGISNKNISESLIITVADSHAILPKAISSEAFGKVFYETALSVCGSADICNLDISTAKRGIIGSVTVDMNNKMAISAIAAKAPIAIQQVGSFNSVEVVDTRMPASIKILNSIHSTVSVTVDNTPVIDYQLSPSTYDTDYDLDNPNFGFVYLDQVQNNCSASECDIQLVAVKQNKSTALLGTITVDVANNMAITKLVPFRGSEVSLFSLDNKTVEIRYPNK